MSRKGSIAKLLNKCLTRVKEQGNPEITSLDLRRVKVVAPPAVSSLILIALRLTSLAYLTIVGSPRLPHFLSPRSYKRVAFAKVDTCMSTQSEAVVTAAACFLFLSYS